jgi:hypothetical protein
MHFGFSVQHAPKHSTLAALPAAVTSFPKKDQWSNWHNSSMSTTAVWFVPRRTRTDSAMDLPHNPRTVDQLQSEVAGIVCELEGFVESLGVFEMTSHIVKKRSGAKVELAFWSPVGEYCQCQKMVKNCTELQHGKFPFRDILHRVQSDVTLEYFRLAVDHEKEFLKKFQSF